MKRKMNTQRTGVRALKALMVVLLAVLLVCGSLASLTACSEGLFDEMGGASTESGPAQGSANTTGPESPYEPKYSENGMYGYEGSVDEDIAPAAPAEATPRAEAIPREEKNVVDSGLSDGGGADSATNADSASSADFANAAEGAGNTSPASTTGSVQTGRKITFWASIALNTKNFDADYKAIISMVNHSNGYVVSEDMDDYSELYDRLRGRTATLKVRVPALGYDSFLDGLDGIGEIKNRAKRSQDLTAEYFDTEARIEMLEIRKERLMAYLVEAKDAKDIVEFERELSAVLSELDSYQSNKRHLDQIVDFSTVDISLTELITPETIGKDGERLGERASNAFAFSASGLGEFLQDVVVFLAGALPVIIFLLVVGVVLWLIVLIVIKARKKRRNKRFAKELAKAQQAIEEESLKVEAQKTEAPKAETKQKPKGSAK
ncbi:MAG: DUF4349 domain-containing protein [Coriobacteriia bacterium]|nr:DUF4349 domain-containing protein [Coriobacteriia bacterium]